MNWTAKEVIALTAFYRQYANSPWKDCPGCGIAFQGTGHQCSDCTEYEEEQRAEAERLTSLEEERQRLQRELLQFGHRLAYTVLRMKKKRLEAIGELLNHS
ncbi:MAG: hypothetical protein KDD01_13595 [Phaeodactylibacter sp.]|nr:hypothetical protein [Phaeodactylibacter sp.]